MDLRWGGILRKIGNLLKVLKDIGVSLIFVFISCEFRKLFIFLRV